MTLKDFKSDRLPLPFLLLTFINISCYHKGLLTKCFLNRFNLKNLMILYFRFLLRGYLRIGL